MKGVRTRTPWIKVSYTAGYRAREWERERGEREIVNAFNAAIKQEQRNKVPPHSALSIARIILMLLTGSAWSGTRTKMYKQHVVAYNEKHRVRINAGHRKVNICFCV